MKLLTMVLSAAVLVLSASAAEASIKRGFYDGKNKSAWFRKSCSLQIHGTSDDSLTVVSVKDSGNVYNVWMHDNPLADTFGPGYKSASGSLQFDMRDASKTEIYSNNGTGAGVFSLVIAVDSTGLPLSYELHQFDEAKSLNRIRCESLKTM